MKRNREEMYPYRNTRSKSRKLIIESGSESNSDEWETEEEIDIEEGNALISSSNLFDKEAEELDDPALKEEYKSIQEYLTEMNKDITLKDILQADNLSIEEKAEAIEMCKILSSKGIDNERIDAIKKMVHSSVKEGSSNYLNPKDLKRLTEEEIQQIKETQKRLKESLPSRRALSLKTQILLSEHADEFKKLLLEKLERTEGMAAEDPEYLREMDVIKLALSLPIGVKKDIGTNGDQAALNIPLILRKIRTNLDKHIGGMTRAKEQILEIVASRFANPHRKRDITALIGEAGMGKTRLVLSLAEALGLPVEIISLGGANDKSILTGFANVYVGAQAGRIIKAIKKMGCVNGIILFDEIDKVSDQTNEIHYALVNIMDPTQNHRFQDEYLQGIEIDISNIWFWASANSIEPINRILRNRMNFVYVPVPTREEKINTFNNYIFPETLANVGLTNNEVKLHEETASILFTRADELFPHEETKGYRKVIELLELVLKKINLIKLYKAEDNDNLPSSYPSLSFPVELNVDLLGQLIHPEDFTNSQLIMSNEIRARLYG